MMMILLALLALLLLLVAARYLINRPRLPRWHPTGKVVVITGATSGIGRECASILAKKGAKLILNARNEQVLSDFVDDLNASSQSTDPIAYAVPGDISDKVTAVNILVTAQRKLGGTIDALVLNAGIAMNALFEEITDVDMFERLMKINYLGCVYPIFHLLPAIKKSNDACIMVTDSLVGIMTAPTRTGYAASKSAVNGFFQALRSELSNRPISISIAYPGKVITSLNKTRLGYDGTTSTSKDLIMKGGMTAEKCASIMVDGMMRRSRTIHTHWTYYSWCFFSIISPQWTDKAMLKAFKEVSGK